MATSLDASRQRWIVLVGWVALATGAHAARAEAPALPTVAMLGLEAEFGLAPGVAKLLTDNLTQDLRRSGAFSTVVSSREIETMLTFERQKELVQCDSASCLAELAGVLGVDLVVAGSIGRLGNSFILNLRMLDVKRAKVVATTSERQAGGSEEALLDAVRPSVAQLLSSAGLKHALPDSAPSAAAEPRAPIPSPAPVEQPAQPLPAHSSPPPWRLPVLGLGAAAVAGGAGLMVLGATLAVASAVAFVLPYVVFVPVPGVPFDQQATFRTSMAALLAAAAVLPVILGLMAGLTGGGGLVAGILAGR